MGGDGNIFFKALVIDKPDLRQLLFIIGPRVKTQGRIEFYACKHIVAIAFAGGISATHLSGDRGNIQMPFAHPFKKVCLPRCRRVVLKPCEVLFKEPFNLAIGIIDRVYPQERIYFK